MAELVFVGLGLGPGSLPHGALDAIKACDMIFLERYTAPVPDDEISRLSKLTGRAIEELDRTAVEKGDAIIDVAKKGRAALLVPGDPMAATTHLSLRMRAAAESISVRIIHASSVFSAIPGILGLQHYKFGRTITVPFHREGFAPTSPYESLVKNTEAGQHTLALLDIDAEKGRYMTSREGIEALMTMEKKVGGDLLARGALCCIVARAGHGDCAIRAGPVQEMLRFDAGEPPHSLVFPAALHFLEAEALVAFAGAPKEILKGK
ncbi:MAG: diphthine synthase [Euryarchaeota archaeon]|nr:diphthine synthase [Euryarchaeota archaeon]